ncbi:MAG: acetate uptake transporter [Actinobacteria bacterium]|nr:acetate uptake transporter [Actinomycetota bacterium]
MANSTDVRVLKDTTANPGPLGLMAFGMTTVLLNIHNAGIYELNAMILAMGIFYGGMAQVFAGWMEWKKGNTFATVAFSSYGLFWLLLVGLILLPKLTFIDGAADLASSLTALGWFFMFRGIFTFLMFIGTLRINRSLQVVFLTLSILFWLLAIRDWTGSELIGKIAGWEGILTGLSAMYGSIAQIWNELYGRVVLPLGPVKK